MDAVTDPTRPAARRIIGIVGAPGAGKSTLAASLVASYGDEVVLVPMDGFHLAQDELVRIGRADRKGAPDTFDVHGFVALLRRVREERDPVIYAPAFDRQLEQAIAGSIAVEPRHSVVVVEGNYLLHDRDGWEAVRPLLDECWYLDVDDESRRRELIDRHVAHGRTRSEAEDWVDRVDEPNAALVAGTRRLADRVVSRDGRDLPR